MADNYGASIVSLAVACIGITEVPPGSNSGPHIDQWLADVDLVPGNPWCAAFACGMVREAMKSLGETWPAPNSGSSGALIDWAQENNAGVSGPDVIPGCFGIEISEDTETGYCHTVIVTAVNLDNGTFSTVEGNSSNRVRRCVRLISSCQFLRPFPDV